MATYTSIRNISVNDNPAISVAAVTLLFKVTVWVAKVGTVAQERVPFPSDCKSCPATEGKDPGKVKVGLLFSSGTAMVMIPPPDAEEAKRKLLLMVSPAPMEAPPLTTSAPVSNPVLSVAADMETVLKEGFGVVISAHDSAPDVLVTNAMLLFFGRADGRVRLYGTAMDAGGFKVAVPDVTLFKVNAPPLHILTFPAWSSVIVFLVPEYHLNPSVLAEATENHMLLSCMPNA